MELPGSENHVQCNPALSTRWLSQDCSYHFSYTGGQQASLSSWGIFLFPHFTQKFSELVTDEEAEKESIHVMLMRSQISWTRYVKTDER